VADRQVMAKHASIYPKPDEVLTLQLLSQLCRDFLFVITCRAAIWLIILPAQLKFLITMNYTPSTNTT